LIAFTLHAAVDRHPGHHLGVGELLPRAAHLPDPLVGVVPQSLDRMEQGLAHRPAAFGRRQPLEPGEDHGVHHLAVDVELELPGGGVADPDGL